ncbi:MAG: DUF1573 domain-containing protein [Bacteroidetes bacterium]|nr:DUF1573 domain-containing protein [Bacteroidota bacterium]
MKKIVFTVMTALFSLGMMAQTPVVSGPQITIDKEVHNFGNIPYGGNGTCEFKVTNTGTEPLILSKCKGSCGCTVPTCEPNPIAAGASTNITVKYDTKRAGVIDKSVTINSNAVNEPVMVVRIKGKVEPDPNAPAPSGVPVREQGGAPHN